jgi:hypothetical protein
MTQTDWAVLKEFYGYQIRRTVHEDFKLAKEWTPVALNAEFWLRQNDALESFLVQMPDGTPLAFLQTQKINVDQVRLHWQPSPIVSRPTILRALTTLVPLIEKALANRDVKAIFFTSHSLTMAWFMEKNLNYLNTEHMTPDGVVLWKVLPGKDFKFTGVIGIGGNGHDRTI